MMTDETVEEETMAIARNVNQVLPQTKLNLMFRYLCRVDRVKRLMVRVVTVLLLVPVLIWAIAKPPGAIAKSPVIREPSGPSEHFKVAYGTLYYYAAWREAYAKADAYQKCEFKNCIPTVDVDNADAVIFHNWDINTPFSVWKPGPNRARQIWIYYGLEPAARTNWYPAAYDGKFNWTMTYKSTSDIQLKYHVFEQLPKSSKSFDFKSFTPLSKKKNTALMVASHCRTSSRREELVKELRKEIDVDVFGKCGKPCPNDCDFSLFEKKYKFYLAFENSKCLEYISEKVWLNALNVGLVPVVLGGYSRKDYETSLPPDSFIYADDFATPKLLAEYLKKIGNDQELYNEFLKWRVKFRVSKSPRYTDLCSICRGLNNKILMSKPRVQGNLKSFWNVTKDCHGTGPGFHKTSWSSFKGYMLYLFGVL